MATDGFREYRRGGNGTIEGQRGGVKWMGDGISGVCSGGDEIAEI